MAGMFSVKSLGDGQLPSSIGVLYTVPAVTQTITKTITLTNISPSAVDINLYVSTDGGSTNRRIIPYDVTLEAGYSLVFDSPLTLEATHRISGDATSASAVDYTISGVEET